MVDDFPEAFKRFEDSLPEEIDAKQDDYLSLKQQFREWQHGLVTPKQDIALQVCLEEYGITPKYGKIESMNRGGHEYLVTRYANGRFKSCARRD